MADIEIPDLPAASALAGTEEIPGDQGGTTKKITPAQIATYVNAAGAAAAAVTTHVGQADPHPGYLKESDVAGTPVAVGTANAAGVSATAARSDHVHAERVLNNWLAVAAPTTGDDSGDGYAVGSYWLDTAASPPQLYQCRDATAAAAVWTPIGPGAAYPDVQVLTPTGSPHTWTKPSWARAVLVSQAAGGGGGAGGRRGAAGTARAGGGGGGGGGVAERMFPASALGATETVTVGAGGAGGAAQTANDSNGNSGVAGGNTSFGPHLRCTGGGGGTGGGTGASAGGTAGTGELAGAAGGAGQATTASAGSQSSGGGSGGGGGAGITSGDVATTGGAGGARAAVWGAAAGGTPSNGGTGNPGAAGPSAAVGAAQGGGGGGGSGAHLTTAPGAGGAGGLYGGGGGGGGASVNGNNSGGGGNGADGVCVVVTW
jgi:hypothetical protein